MELVADTEDHVLLLTRQVELAVNLTVHTLACLTTDSDDSGIGLSDLMLHATLRDFYLVELGLTLVEEPHHRVLVGLQLRLGILDVVLVYLGQQGCRRNTDILQTLHHIYHVGHIDATRAQTSREEVVAVDTEQSHRLQVTDRQHTSVLQQYHTLGRRLTSDL